MKTYAGSFDLRLNKKLLIKKHTGQSMCHFHKVCSFLFKCSQFNLVGFLQSLILPYCVKPQEILWMWFYLRFYCSMDLLLIFFFFSAFSLPSTHPRPHAHPVLFFGKEVGRVCYKAILGKNVSVPYILRFKKLPAGKKKKKKGKWGNVYTITHS